MCNARRKPKSSVILVVATALLLLAVGGAAVRAQTGGGYSLTWHTVDNGGGRLTGGSYTLAGAAGQPEPGPALTGGGYTLYSGFCPGAGAAPSPPKKYIYLPLVLRNS
ncbi:MAG: hypothetical protein U9R05_08550 [Chloroflexota bacterium]|nr:hypothetical protein [Chloroflexota bacterium]